jgi:hypothetical protein
MMTNEILFKDTMPKSFRIFYEVYLFFVIFSFLVGLLLELIAYNRLVMIALSPFAFGIVASRISSQRMSHGTYMMEILLMNMTEVELRYMERGELYSRSFPLVGMKVSINDREQLPSFSNGYELDFEYEGRLIFRQAEIGAWDKKRMLEVVKRLS